ncbi:MAG: hypothetical protein Q4F28_05815 [Eubacteriales bacterium]|nr:hypothetical protein [Eubacteriales bacterium]
MEYQTLEKTDTFCVYQAFRQAFSDYQVPVDMPYEAFETNLKRNGYMPSVSVGAFEHGELTGIVLMVCGIGREKRPSTTLEPE